MSYTEIFAFGKDGSAYGVADIKNSHRGAMAIWRILESKYLPPYMPSWGDIGGEYSRTTAFEGDAMKAVWRIYELGKVSKVDAICLCTTFDKMLVKRENVKHIINAFNKFEGETSLKEQATALEEVLKDKDVVAVGWNQTSVNCDTWASYGYDDEKEEEIPYNCLTQDDHDWVVVGEEKFLCDPSDSITREECGMVRV